MFTEYLTKCFLKSFFGQYLKSLKFLKSFKVFLRLFVGGHPGVTTYVMQGPSEVAKL